MNEQCTMNNVQWKKVKLGEVIVDSYAGGTPNRSRSDYFGGDIPWVSSGEVNNPEINSTLENISIEGLNNSSAKWIPENSILVALYGATAGQVSMLRIKATSNQAVLAVIPKADVADTMFLFYQIVYNKDNLLYLAQGSGQPNLSKNLVDGLEISVPDLSAQRRIAAILASADKVIDSTQRLIEKYKKMKQGMMEELLNEQCTMNNVQWRKVRLGEVGEIISGGTPSTTNDSFWNGEILFVTPLDLGKQNEIHSTFRTITELGVNNSSANLIKSNSLAVSTRAPIGLMSIVNNAFTTNQGCKSIQFFENQDVRFFYYYLSHNVEYIRRFGQGTTFMEISKTDFSNLEFSVPDLPEQRRIAKILSGIDAKIAAEEKVLEKYKEVKKGLMERLLEEGK